MARRPSEPDYDDDAPWLSSVEDERRGMTLVPQRRLVGGIVVFLVLLGLILGGLYWITARARQGGSSAGVSSPEEAPLIAADQGPYKVPPSADDPKGLSIDGASSDMHATGEGETVTGALDPSAMTEDPLPRPGVESEPRDLLPPAAGASESAAIPPAGTATKPVARPVELAKPATKPIELPKTATPKPVELAAPKPVPLKPLPKPVAAIPGTPPAKPASGSASLQLGAFSSSAKADSVWSDYSKRFKYLGGLGKSVTSVDRDGTKLYRLRATGVADREAAGDLCSRLKIAGVECVVAQ